MELLENAESNNDFGLRKRFPWTGSEHHAPWTEIVTDPLETAFVMSKVWKQNPVIKRVENPYLWARYVLHHEELNANEYLSPVKERIVLHSTTSRNALNIAAENFDWRRVVRHRYGRGVSFSPNASYANGCASGRGVFIIAGISVGRLIKGNSKTRITSGDYDTTQDRRGFVYVKYYDDEYYPYYIVE